MGTDVVRRSGKMFESLCNSAHAAWERYQAGAIPSPTVDVMLNECSDCGDSVRLAKLLWPGVQFNIHHMPSVREMSQMASASGKLEEIRKHVERFPVAVNTSMSRNLMEITMGARGWEAWLLRLRELVGAAPPIECPAEKGPLSPLTVVHSPAEMEEQFGSVTLPADDQHPSGSSVWQYSSDGEVWCDWDPYHVVQGPPWPHRRHVVYR